MGTVRLNILLPGSMQGIYQNQSKRKKTIRSVFKKIILRSKDRLILVLQVNAILLHVFSGLFVAVYFLRNVI